MGKPPSSTLAMVYFLIRERQYKFHIHSSENLCVWGKMEHVHFKNRFIDCNKFLYFTRARRKTRKQAHPLENPLNHPTNTLGQLSLPRAEVFIHIYIYIYLGGWQVCHLHHRQCRWTTKWVVGMKIIRWTNYNPIHPSERDLRRLADHHLPKLRSRFPSAPSPHALCTHGRAAVF